MPPAAVSAPAVALPHARRRRRLDALVSGLARTVARIFYRDIEVLGSSRLPPTGPLVVVANHQNAMVDPLLILAGLSRYGREPRFLAAHVLWRNWVLRPWVELADVIPVYRVKDVGQGADPERNAAAFARCHEQLAAGGAIALFPEGIGHSAPGLAPLRTGAARIVLEAARRFPGLRPLVLPLGLTFEARGTFRSRALLMLGEPIDPAPEIALDQGGGEEGAATGAADRLGAAAGAAASGPAVRALTGRIAAGLAAVTLSYDSWDEARRLGRAAELFSRPPGAGAGLPGEAPLGRQFAFSHAVIEGYGELRRRDPAGTAAAAEAVERYDRMLTALALRDDQVTATYPPVAVAGWVGRTLLRLVLQLPLALVGIVLNWPPYRLIGEIAARAGRTPDLPATYKVFGGLLFFPLTWFGEAALAFRLLPPGTPGRAAGALGVLLAAPLTGWVALHFDERRERLWREARAYLLLRSRRAIATELRARREAAWRAVRAVADLPAEAGRG